MQENDYFRIALSHIVNERGRGTQNTLSIDTGLSDAYISQVIAGKRSPSVNVQIKIVKALGIDYLDFLALGKKLTFAGLSLPAVASDMQKTPIESSLPSAYDMLLKSLMDQISELKDTIRELKEERAKNIADMTRELKRCWSRMDEMQSHTGRMNETIDKMNLLMIDAARAGDISILERISGNGK